MFRYRLCVIMIKVIVMEVLPKRKNTRLQNSIVSRFVSTFKRFCNKEYGKNIWQNRSYDHVIRNQEDYDEHLKYIFENPARWELDKLYSG